MGDLNHSDPRFRDQRRKAVAASPTLVGLDHIDVRHLDTSTSSGTDSANELWDLNLHFLPPSEQRQDQQFAALPSLVEADNIRIEFGENADPAIHVRQIMPLADHVLRVRVARNVNSATPPAHLPADLHLAAGHLPIYRLRLVDLPTVDRFFDQALFAFRDGTTDLGLPSELPEQRPTLRLPEIDYLSKDYESFRQLLLDRLKREVPSWHERNPADLGVTLVELLAYAGDYLSYYQDAVSSEAYIATARQRISIRRHARLVDYRMHEGVNARCWVQIKILPTEAESGSAASAAPEPFELPAGTEVLTSCGQVPAIVPRLSREERKARAARPLVFQTLFPVRLHPLHNRIEIYTWGATTYRLRAGDTRAALVGHLPHLHRGDVLIFERMRLAETLGGNLDDLPTSQPVRLAHHPRLSLDPTLGDDGQTVPVTEIEWLAEDGLDHDLEVSVRIGGKVRLLACARGNNVLVDHGESRYEVLPQVPANQRYGPRLRQLGLTRRVPYDSERASRLPAHGNLEQDPRQALPALELYELAPVEFERYPDGVPLEVLGRTQRQVWRVRHDLLASDRFGQDLVVETDDRGYAQLRFGDDRQGLSPYPGSRLQAVYRVGSGPAGNVGAYALRHLVIASSELERCADLGLRLIEARNQLAGHGGLESENSELARHYAPQALHSGRLRRCVTEDDYARVAERHPEVERAVSRLHWNGTSWVAFIYVQRPALRTLDSHLKRRLLRFFAPFLLADCEVEIRSPRWVPLDLCFLVHPQGSAPQASMRQRLGTRVEQGELPFLAPDYFTFGKPLYLSELITQIMELPEVSSVEAKVFKRWGESSQGELEQGEISLAPLEIAVLRNDPSAPHLGSIQVRIEEEA